MRQFSGARPGRDDFAPQPFDQVVAIARAAGHPRDADWFAREKRIFRRRCGLDGALGALWSRFTGLFCGHYFSPARAFATLAGTIMLGVLLLATANQQPPRPYADPTRPGDTILLSKRRSKVEVPPEQAFGGSRENRFEAESCWEPGRKNFHTLPTASGLNLAWPARYGVFADVAVTAFDLLLPVVELRMDDRCEVNDDALGHEWWSAAFALYSVLGVIILPMFLATVTGLLKREGS